MTEKKLEPGDVANLAPGLKVVGCHVIQEAPDGIGWFLYWPTGGREHHNSAAEALMAVKAHAEILKAGGVSSVALVEWHPETELGRQVVAVLTQEGP